MRMVSLKLRGFKGIRAGMGLDEIFLDLAALPVGLIAIVGDNGRGKSTVLDSMTPYRLMPYKLRESKEWSPNAFSYYDQCYGEACKELIFEIGGCLYKSLILINAEKRKQDAFLFGGIKQLTGEIVWTPLNDGKTGTYDLAIEKVCGSPTLFFSSVFRSQDARKLSSYPRSEILSIVSELLNIDHIKEQGDKAKEVANIELAEVQKLQVQIDAMLPTIAKKAELENNKTITAVDLSNAEKYLAENKEKLTNLQTAYHDAEIASAAQVEARKRLNDMTARQTELKDAITKTSTKVIDDEIWMITSSLEQADNIRALANGKEETETLLETAKTETEKLRADYHDAQIRLTKLQENGSAIQVSTERLKSLGQARRQRKLHLQADIVRYTKQAASLDVLDCRADSSSWVNEACPLLVDAVAAKAKIPALEIELADCESSSLDEDVLTEQIATLTDERATMGDPKAEVERLKTEGIAKAAEVTALEAKLKVIHDNAAKVAGLLHAETRLKELRDRKAELESSRFDAAAKLEQVTAEYTALRSILDEDVTKKLADIQRSINSFKMEVDSAQLNISNLHSEMGRINGQLAVIAEKETEAAGIQEEIDRLNADIADWLLLARACSNDGIIALEIDDAGPAIAGLANDLLSACYGPRFSVRLETQAVKNDGTLKEVFDITVFDSLRDEEKSIRDMSGGETVFVEDAITRAICLYNLNNSAIRFETIYSDEKDGALDPEKKREFLAIKRRALEVGNHDREFFISQTIEMQEGADAKIILQPGSITIA